jgi:TatA/E family protein of Tat protein translocase
LDVLTGDERRTSELSGASSARIVLYVRLLKRCYDRNTRLLTSLRRDGTMFGPLGGPELILIFVIALIIFGPRKLPEVGKSLGKMMAEFRRASNDLKRTIETEVEMEQLREDASIKVSDIAADDGSADRKSATPSEREATAVDSPSPEGAPPERDG